MIKQLWLHAGLFTPKEDERVLGFSLRKSFAVVKYVIASGSLYPGFWVRADTYEPVDVDFWTSLPTWHELTSALTDSMQAEVFFDGVLLATSAGNECVGLHAGADRSREIGYCEREVLRQDPQEDTRSQASIRRVMLEREAQAKIDGGG